MKINDVVKGKREELGVDPVHLAEKCGLTISGYSDLEDDETEFYMVVPLRNLFALCDELDLDLIKLYGFGECEEPLADSFLADKIFRSGLSIEALSDGVGIAEQAIKSLISDYGSLLGWVMDPIIDLSKALGLNPSCLLNQAERQWKENKKHTQPNK